jgi:HK97 family phage portal protein
MAPRLLRRRKTEDRDLTRETLPPVLFGEGGSPESPGVRQSLGIADVFACVRVLQDGAIMCPLEVFQRTAQDTTDRVTDGATAALLEQPAPGISQPTFVGQMVATLTLWGEVFVGKFRAADGSVEQLGLLAPDRMVVEVVSGEPRFTYFQPQRPPAENLTLDDVIYIRSGITLDGVRGASPVKVAREAMGLSKSLTDAGAALWANGAVPGGILKVPQGAGGDDQAQALADGWAARHEGAKQRGRIAVVTGEINFQPVTMALSDAEWVASRKLSTAEICRLLGVPPWMVGASSGESMTYSNVQQEADHFARFSLGPKLRLLEAGLSADADLFPQPGLTCKFNLDGLLRADAETRFKVYEAALRSGVMTPDEVRAIEDLPPTGEPEE